MALSVTLGQKKLISTVRAKGGLTGGDRKKNPGVLAPEFGIFRWAVQRQIFRINAMYNAPLIPVIVVIRDRFAHDQKTRFR